jgi:DNA replication and repair protein RecF
VLDDHPPDDAAHASAPVTLRRLTLSYFRNYAGVRLDFDARSVVLVGANGAGKTNILEAISLLAPGRGLRRAAAPEIANTRGPGTWAVAARIEGPAGEVEIGTGLEGPAGDGEAGGRVVRVDRVARRSSTALGEYVSVLWLTPDQDALFRGPAGDRRRFLDRFALALDAEHGARVATLEKLHRQRNRLLEEARPDPLWLDAVERELAEAAIAVAATRTDATRRLAAIIAAHDDPTSPFPDAVVALEGEVETWLEAGAAEAEDRYRASLRELRPRDAAAGRGTFGPHLSDLLVVHGPKGVPAERASTGEQKALLVGLILAQARLVAEATGRRPFLLLDEITAHLDAVRRAALFEEIDRLGAQAFMTGTDPHMFASLGERARVFAISEGEAAEMKP